MIHTNIWKGILIVVLLLFIFFLFCNKVDSASEATQIIVVFLYNDFSSLSSVANDHWNDSTSNGWFAVSRGKLILPPVTVANPCLWGESGAHDLVNSVRLALAGSGSITGALLAADHGEVYGELPAPIGVWEFTGPAGLSGELTFRYDAAKAAELEEYRISCLIFQC